jgi:hypothetical protein
MAAVTTKTVHEAISTVHIRIAELGITTADAAEEKVCEPWVPDAPCPPPPIHTYTTLTSP